MLITVNLGNVTKPALKTRKRMKKRTPFLTIESGYIFFVFDDFLELKLNKFGTTCPFHPLFYPPVTLFNTKVIKR